MSGLISLQVTIFLLVAVGFAVKRLRIVNSQGQKDITDLVINVILPCNIFKAFMVDFDPDMISELTGIFLVSILVQVIFILYGKFMFRKESEGHRKCLEYGTICSNAGFLGNPIAEGVFGSYGLVLASVFLIPMRIMMWSEGIATFSGVSDKKATVKKVCTHPCIIACILGVIVLITGFRPISPITKTITYLGNCNTALSMMVIGMILADMKLATFKDISVILYSVHRLVLLPLIIMLVTLLLPVSKAVVGVSTLLSAMPAGATTSILAAKYDMEPEFATKMVITSTLLSLPSIFVWSLLLTNL